MPAINIDMAVDPRKFTVSDRARNCAPRSVPADTRAKDFFSLVGKAGDLEVLNEIDNNIGQGLRTLAGISENVRNNSGPVPNIIRDTGEAALDTGANFVLDTVGVGSRQIQQASQFSPQVANRALGQARSVYDAVRNGQFDEFEDLPTAIAEFSNAEQLIRRIKIDGPERVDQFQDQCVSPYARDLIARAPKHKFMFVVEFVLNEPYASQFGNDLSEEFAFVVKRAARPNITFEYEEVNFYNFRSKILKRHEYQPINMSFYDDHNGKAITFWHEYLKALSPLSANTPGDATAPKLYEANSMNFQFFSFENDSANQQLTAGISALRSNANGITPTTVISHINLYHVYRGGSKFDQYQFISPKITELTLDELDMTQSGDGSEVALTFTYDALAMFAGNDMDSATSDDLDALTDSGQYSMRPAPASQGNAVTSRSYDVTGPPTRTPTEEALTDVIDESINIFTNG